MTIIAQDVARRSDLVKWELEPSQNISKGVVEVADLSKVAFGTVLAKGTDGKYLPVVQGAGDKTGKAVAVVLEVGTKVGVPADKTVLALVRLARVSKKYLVLDAAFDDAAKKQVVYDALAEKVILADDSI